MGYVKGVERAGLVRPYGEIPRNAASAAAHHNENSAWADADGTIVDMGERRPSSQPVASRRAGSGAAPNAAAPDAVTPTST